MRALYSLVLSIALAMAGVTAAFADHMTGRYDGVGDVAGTTLVVQQSGLQVTGQLSGGDNGTLRAQSDGGDNFRGTVSLAGVGDLPVQGRWSQDGLILTVAGANGTFDFEFRPAGAAQPERPTNTNTTTIAQPAAANFYYIVDGAQRGPVTSEALVGLIEDGTISRTTLIWQPGQGEWSAVTNFPAFAELLPPPPPVEATYYVLADGVQVGPLTVADVLARIEAGETVSTDLAWTNGLEAWQPIGEIEAFADAFVTPVAPPPPPPVNEPEVVEEIEEELPPPPPVVETPPPPPAQEEPEEPEAQAEPAA